MNWDGVGASSRPATASGPEVDVETGNPRSYVICTTARSGSNLFCNYLTNTRRLGRPGEMLNPDMVRTGRFARELQPDMPISTEAYFAWLTQTFSSKQGIFGIKLLYEDFENFVGFPIFQKFLTNSTIYVLRRRSKLKQAISYFFAEKTGQWVATDPPLLSMQEVEFDFARIEQHLRRLTLQDTTWITHLEAMRLPYREIIFEDFLGDPHRYLAMIAEDVGVDPSDMPVEASLREQKNPRSAEFANRFAALYGARLFAERDKVRYKGLAFAP
jgi:LPS sulfotransferase NodH